MWMLIATTIVAVTLTHVSALTDPLPKATIEPQATSVRCPTKQRFEYSGSGNTEGKDIVIYYRCSDDKSDNKGADDKSDLMSVTIHCANGMKATYRRDLIPGEMRKAAIEDQKKRGYIPHSYGEEPDFGLFSDSRDNYELKNGAVFITACLAMN